MQGRDGQRRTRRRRGLALAALALLPLGALLACRTGEPAGDPKTPANSPLPNVDRKEPDPTTPVLGDGG